MFEMMTQEHALAITGLLAKYYEGVTVSGNMLDGQRYRITAERTSGDMYEMCVTPAASSGATSEPLALPEVARVLRQFINRYAGDIVDTNFYR